MKKIYITPKIKAVSIICNGIVCNSISDREHGNGPGNGKGWGPGGKHSLDDDDYLYE